MRPSQREAIDIARRQLDAGQHKLHIIAPPGSGKTVLGLYLWAEYVRAPALVLSPNSAIQAQWAARVDLFDGIDGGASSIVSTDTGIPGLLTSLTYQAVTLPGRGTSDTDKQAISLWQENLIEKGQAKDFDEAAVWIDDLKRHNPKYYKDRLSSYSKELRDEAAIGGEVMRLLHASSRETLERLKRRGIGLIILDECHHLLRHWGRVLSEIHEYLDHPIVLGLTATPPDRCGQRPEDLARYDEFFGLIDYEVPVPAVIKDGFLAPYQDLVLFVRPTADELAFIAKVDEQLNALVEELCVDGTDVVGSRTSGASCVPHESLDAWLQQVLTERRLPVGFAKNWESFEKRDEVFARAARLFLKAHRLALPYGVPMPPPALYSPTKDALGPSLDMSILVPVLDRYIRHRLRASSEPADHEKAKRAIARLRMLGVQVTETGTQVCASPVGRVLMYSRSKVAALLPILHAERKALGDRIRAVIVTDFEKTSAITAEVSHLLDEEAGGAIAAFRTLLSDHETDELNPVLVTGSSVLVDDDLAPRFAEAAAAWLDAKGIDVKLEFAEESGFHLLNGSGSDWCPRVYVGMITDLFQKGLTKCLVGTRGLLGEGWDATKINVLVDLTTVTTSTSVNQLRGRSFRLDPDDPAKLADNWDVVCLAPEFTKGLDDYLRFIEKHNTLFGLTDDGAVEKGVGHVHAAFTEIRPEGIEDSMAVLNAEMLERPKRRPAFRNLWRIGQPYHSAPIHAVESQIGGGGGDFPPFPGAKSPWTGESLAAAVSEAVLGALRDIGVIPYGTGALHIGTRSGGYVRSFLKDATTEASAAFSEALHEALGPFDNPRYVIPRYVEFREKTWLSRILPRFLGQYFQRSRRSMQLLHAVPSAFAKNKDLAVIFQRHWNAHVSPGEVVFTQRGEGEQLLEFAMAKGLVPKTQPNRKEVFV